jgi:hypothetical protein
VYSQSTAGSTKQQQTETLQVLGLLPIVRFLVQLTLGFYQQRLDVQLAWQQAGHAQQCSDIIDIAVDTLADAGVLDFQRQTPPITGHRCMHLPDRGGRQRRKGKAPKALFPVAAPAVPEHLRQLAQGHRPGVGPQASQDFREFRWQQRAAVHGQQLTQFHRGTTQVGELFRHTARVGGCQHQVGGAGQVTA